MRQAVAQPRRARSRPVPVIAPIRGLYLDQSPARPADGTAEVLENWIPTDRGARVRGGLQASATTGGDAVTSLFAYNHPSNSALFAATATDVYDMSALDPDTPPAADLSSRGAGYYSTAQIGTVGGQYLVICNGADAVQHYDGSSWAAPSITGVTSSTLSAVWLYRNRLFFVEKDTLNAWYLPVDSIAGAAQSVSLAGVFQKGGSLLFGATWSLDSGDGLDDKNVFVSTSGEVAIYEGADPSDPADWRLAGRYDIAKPLGINATMQAGGDLLIATVEGIVPLSQVIQKDPAAIALSAVSRPIESLWTFEAQRATSPVELLKWSDRGIGVVTLPESSRMLIVNLQSGGWGVATGWVGTCAATFLSKAYIGRSDGSIVAIDETGLDVDEPFTARYCGGFGDFGSPDYKVAQMMRGVFYSSGQIEVKASVAVNFMPDDFPSAPPSASEVVSEDYLVWDVGNWDEKLWWSSGVEESTTGYTTLWLPVSGAGHVVAPQWQITSGTSTKLNVELVRTDFLFESGEMVV